MVLVDTSVWIHFLAGRTPYREELDRLLKVDEQVVGHELVYGELLIGDRGGRSKFLNEYEQVPRANSVRHSDVVNFVRIRKLYGKGVGWVDTHLLASAVLDRLQLWTADPRLAAVASEIGVGYRRSSRVGSS